jgi:hypothetical protein
MLPLGLLPCNRPVKERRHLITAATAASYMRRYRKVPSRGVWRFLQGPFVRPTPALAARTAQGGFPGPHGYAFLFLHSHPTREILPTSHAGAGPCPTG